MADRMPPKLSKFYGVKRDERMRILDSYTAARQRTKLQKEALQAVANEFGFAFGKVKTLVYRYNPEKQAHLRLHKRNSLTFEQEAQAVGITLGMANISKPLSINVSCHDEKPAQGRESELWSQMVQWLPGPLVQPH